MSLTSFPGPARRLILAIAVAALANAAPKDRVYFQGNGRQLNILWSEWAGVSFVGFAIQNGQVNQGLLLRKLEKQSPFRQAGLQQGDVLYGVGHHGAWLTTNLDPRGLMEALALTPEGVELDFLYLRKLKERDGRIRIGADPPPGIARFLRDAASIRGLWVAAVPPWASAVYAAGAPGVVVLEVPKRSAWAPAKLKKGDIITGVGDAAAATPEPAAGVEQFAQLVAGTAARGPVRFFVSRRGTASIFTVAVPPGPDLAWADPGSRPSLAAESVAVSPTPVRAGETFDLAIRYRAADPGASRDRIPVHLRYRILAGANSLLESEAVPVDSFNGGVTAHTVHLRAASQPGYYIVEVQLEYGTAHVTETAALKVE